MTDRFLAQVALTQGVALKDANGDPDPQTGTDGAADVKRPSDVYGAIVRGEQDMNGVDTAAPITITTATGFKGIKIDTAIITAAAAGTNSLFVAVSANNTVYNDVAVAGLRHISPVNRDFIITFLGTPLPTQIQIGLDTDPGAADTVILSYAAAQE